MDKDKQLTAMQVAFLSALPDTNGNIRDAMRAAGYSDNYKALDLVKSLKDEIIDLAKNMLAMNAPKAVAGMVDVLDSPNILGANNKLAAAKELLDRAGVIKEEPKDKGDVVKVHYYLPEKNSTPLDKPE